MRHDRCLSLRNVPCHDDWDSVCHAVRVAGFLKTHPFWTLLIFALMLGVFTYFLFVLGHGSGGMDLGPIQQGK